MRKLFSFFAVLTVLLFMLACGGGKGKETIETDEDTTDVEISDNDSDGAEISDEDSDNPEKPEATENHQFSGAYQIGSSVSGVSVAIVECGKTIELASGKTDASGKFSFNADISADKTYCITANGFASCFKGLSDHVANISEITTAAYLVDKTCSDIRKSETKVRAYTKLGTGIWLGELDYSRLSGIKTGLKLLSSFLNNTTDSKTLSEKIAADVNKTEGREFEKFFNGFKISANKKEVLINTANPDSNEVSLNIEGGSSVVAEGFKIVWTAMNSTAEAATHKIKSTEPGEYTVRSKLVDDGGDPIMISEDSSTILFLLEKISGTIDVSDMSKHVSHYITNGIYAVIPKNTVIKKDGGKVDTLTYKIMMTGDGSQISKIDFGPEGVTFTNDSLYFVYELGTVFGGDPIMLSAKRANSDGSSEVLQSSGGDPIMLEAGGDPIMFSAGGDPIMQIARSAGGDPIMQSAGGDPIMNAAGEDPIMNAAGGDPIMTSAAGDPIMSTAAGDPIMMGTSSSVMVAKTNHFSGFQLNSTSLPVSAADLISKWCGDYYYQNYSPVEFIRRGIEKFKPAGDDKTDLLNYFQCPASGETPLYELESDLSELFNKTIGYKRNINLIENLYYVSEFYNRMLAKRGNGEAAAAKNGLELRSAIATLFTSTDAFNRSSTLTGLFDSADIPLTYSGVTPADYSADALSALTGLSEFNDKYAATKKEVMIFANYIMTSSKGPDFSNVSSALTPDKFVCAWFTGNADNCNKVYTLNSDGRVALNGTAVSLADAEQIFAKFFMPFNSRLSDEEKLDLFRTYYLVLRYVGTIFGNSSKIQELNDRLLETAYLVFDGINKNKNAVSIVDTFDASAHTVLVLENGSMETKPYLNKLSSLTDKISLNVAAPANVEKVLIKIEGYAHEQVSDNAMVYYKPTGNLKEKPIILTPGNLAAGTKPLKELIGSNNVDELGNITGRMTVVVNSKISGKSYSTQKTYEFLVNETAEGVETKPVPSNISIFLADSAGNQLPVDSNPGIILNPGNKVLYPNESGTIDITDLAPAAYTINAFADGYYTKTVNVNVPENSTFGVEIRLDEEPNSSAEATLKIKVGIKTQKHPNTVYIQIYDEEMVLAANESTVFGEGGYADIDIDIATGRYTLLAVGTEMYNYIEEITVYEGNNEKEITVVAKNACGNGIIDSGEECEVIGSEIPSARCGDIYPASTYPDKTVSCNPDSCVYDKTGCGKRALCGDGIIDTGEICDTKSRNCSEIAGFEHAQGIAPCNNCEKWVTAGNCSRTTETCTGLPANAFWNDGTGKFSQTHDGTKWMPQNKTASYGVDKGECVFSCEKGYKWKDGRCTENPLSTGNICTGQTFCYDNSAAAECPVYGKPLFGQDSQYADAGFCTQKSLSTSGSGSEIIIVDNFTRLKWQKTVSTAANWDDANQFCSQSDYGNSSGSITWRLPTPAELLTIVDGNNAYPALVENFDTTGHTFWSTEDERNSANAWMMGENGEIKSVAKTSKNHVLCVSKGQYDPVTSRFETAEETVTDKESSLMWQKQYVSSRTWNEALSYCEEVSTGSYYDWRLPNKNELASLIDFEKSSGVASELSVLPAHKFWTSTTSAGSASEAWAVDFATGAVESASKSDPKFVICVRNDGICFGKECADPCVFEPCKNIENSTGSCSAENGIFTCGCKSGFNWNSGKCLLNTTRYTACTGLPENAHWNTVFGISQTFDGENWIPSEAAYYSKEASSSECRYDCNKNYYWEAVPKKCLAQTRLEQCTGKPAYYSVYNTATNIQQTWNGDAWEPSEIASYNETPSSEECRFKCKNEHFNWNNYNKTCDPEKQNNIPCTTTVENIVWWHDQSTVNQTWDDDSNDWKPSATGQYNDDVVPGTNGCFFKCAGHRKWDTTQGKCVCEDNYYGQNCINPCDDNPCSDIAHSTCTATSETGYTCGCESGYVMEIGKCQRRMVWSFENDGEDTSSGNISVDNSNTPYHWARMTTLGAQNGSYAMCSENYHKPSSTAEMTITVNMPKRGIFYFYIKGTIYPSHSFKLYLDGNANSNIVLNSSSGWDNWTQKGIILTAGQHTLKFSYAKSSNTTHSGTDRLCIDYLEIFNLPECSINSDTPCYDKSSGLMWSDVTTGNWEQAKTYCFYNYDVNGLSGWHLPDINELRTLIQNCSSVETDGECPVKDPDCLTANCLNDHLECLCGKNDTTNKLGVSENLWSSSPVEDDDSLAWYTFLSSSKHRAFVTYRSRTDSDGDIRCVKKVCNAGQAWTGQECLPECSSSSGTPCYDSTSGLTWSKASSETKTWQDAINECKSLKDGGLSGWRLPNITELRTLIKGCYATAAGGFCLVQDPGCLFQRCATSSCSSCSSSDNTFGISTNYYSSSSLADSHLTDERAWVINFSSSKVDTDSKTAKANFRCVRGGCGNGYFWDGSACVPNPCESKPCGEEHAVCTPKSETNYSCACYDSGYFFDSSVSECLNPCVPNQCETVAHSTGDCISKNPTTYSCKCDAPQHYYWDAENLTCEYNTHCGDGTVQTEYTETCDYAYIAQPICYRKTGEESCGTCGTNYIYKYATYQTTCNENCELGTWIKISEEDTETDCGDSIPEPQCPEDVE